MLIVFKYLLTDLPFIDFSFVTMKKNTKKERFFTESLKLIHEKGFKATTMRDIASKLNFEVANVYNYIDSKNALLETFLFGMQDEFHDSLDEILDSSYDPKEKMRLVVSSYIKITSKRPYEQALLVNEWRNLKAPKLQEFIQRRKEYENKIKIIFQEGVDNNQFENIDVEIATATILAALRWLYKKYIDSTIKINSLEIEKQLTRLIFNGISSN